MNKSGKHFAESSDIDEKREILKFVFRTLKLDLGNLGYSLHTPFVYAAEIAKSPNWRSRDDSNV